MKLINLYTQILKPGHTVLDIGAFNGSSARVFAELVGTGGSVHSFEPHPVHFLSLSHLAGSLSGTIIKPYCKALSNRNGHLSFFASAEFENPSHREASTTDLRLANEERLGKNILRLTVECTRLDDFCSKSHVTPDLIKVDVEGAEARVFQAGLETIEASQPYIVFEFGWEPGLTLTQHWDDLGGLGYQFYFADFMYVHGRWVTDDTDHLIRATLAEVKEQPMFLGNVLAIPPSKAADFPLRTAIIPMTLNEKLRSL